MNKTEPFKYLENGSYIPGINLSYTQVLGDWYYVFIALFFLSAVLISTKNPTAVFVSALIMAGFMFMFLPVWFYAALFLLLSIPLSIALFKMFG